MSHTPGPWFVGADEPFVYALNDAGTNRFFLAVQSGWLTNGGTNKPRDMRTPFEEVMANGRLIAAAPDLLEALKEVLDSLGALNRPWELEGYGITASRAEQICELVAKAESK